MFNILLANIFREKKNALFSLKFLCRCIGKPESISRASYVGSFKMNVKVYYSWLHYTNICKYKSFNKITKKKVLLELLLSEIFSVLFWKC